MNITAIDWVLDHSRATGKTRLVLLVIARHCNDEGEAFPSHARIAAKAKVSRNTVIQAIATLEELGELVVHRGLGPAGRGGTTNLYELPKAARYSARLSKRKPRGFEAEAARFSPESRAVNRARSNKEVTTTKGFTDLKGSRARPHLALVDVLTPDAESERIAAEVAAMSPEERQALDWETEVELWLADPKAQER